MKKCILILSFRTCSSCTQPIEQMLIAQDMEKHREKDEPASENHNLDCALRGKFCKGVVRRTELINVYFTAQQHTIHKQENCPNPPRVANASLPTIVNRLAPPICCVANIHTAQAILQEGYTEKL